MDAELAFEDFTPGRRFALPPYPVTREAVIAFAKAYDPQPFHLDEAAAKKTLLGGLAASGWHTCGMMMRMMVDGYLGRSTSQGASHVEAVRWLRPVRPGDVLQGECVVESARPSASRPGLGMATISVEVRNGDGEPVLAGRFLQFLLARGAEAVPLSRPGAGNGMAVEPAGLTAAPVRPQAARFWDAIEVGDEETLGSVTFDRDGVLAFARDFDPQRFHLDEAAARSSLFGGLCASGWQVTAEMMRLIVEANRRRVAAWMETGDRPAPLFGPSPGARDLRWTRPVYAGDTLTYSQRVTGKRVREDRPGWGLLEFEMGARNQAGDPAFAMKGAVLLGTG